MESSGPKITGKDYSVYNPTKARLGLRLWTEAFVRALPKQPDDPSPPPAQTE